MGYRLTTDKTWSATLRDLTRCFEIWGVRRWEVESDGISKASWSQNEATRAVHLHFEKFGGATVDLTYSAQARAQDNLRVLFLAVDAMRLNEKRGIGDLIRDSYLQLAAPPRARNPREVLGIAADADIEIAEATFRVLAKRAHPDAGGTAEQMAELNIAIDALRAAL